MKKIIISRTGHHPNDPARFLAAVGSLKPSTLKGEMTPIFFYTNVGIIIRLIISRSPIIHGIVKCSQLFGNQSVKASRLLFLIRCISFFSAKHQTIQQL